MAAATIVVATGQRLAVSPVWDTVNLRPTTDLNQLTLVLPDVFQDTAFLVNTDHNIANFSCTSGTALKIMGCPIQLAAGETLTFVYTAVVSTWSVTIGGETPGTVTAGGTFYILGGNPLIAQIDPTGVLQDTDVGLILRQGTLYGLSLNSLVPPTAPLLSGHNDGFVGINLDQTLEVIGNTLKVNTGTTAGTIATGDGLASTTTVANAALPRAGGTMTGALTLAGAPTNDLHASTKLYVDSAITTLTSTVSTVSTAASNAQATATAAMPKSGGTFTGAVILAANPTSGSQAANKTYVDTGDSTNATAAASALSAATAAQATASAALVASNNLSDLTSPSTARLNLSLGPAALLSVGQITGTVAAGDDARIVGAIQTSAMGAVNGVATLDSNAKLTLAQLPPSVVGFMVYTGTWNALTNTPTLVSSVGTKGQFYVVSVAGTTTIDTIQQWNVGDWIVFDGTRWDKLDGLASEVISVAGLTGAITLSQLVAAGLAPLASPILTGVPSAPTASANTNTSQVATTAFVIGQGYATAASTAITSGAINNTTIGATTANTGAFTTLTATSMVAGSPTGGNKGAGTINATALYINGTAVSVSGLSAATTTTLGGVIVPSAGGLLVDGSGNLSVNWVSPGSIGSTTPAAGKFTTLTATGTTVVSSGSALATSATSGFLYIPTTAGIPTGTPGTQAGALPLIIDSTDNRLYFYSGGAWQNATASSGLTVPNSSLIGGNGTTLTSVTVGTGLTFSSSTLSVTNPYSASAVAITGGNIDSTAIGATTRSTGAFTTLSATGNVVFSSGSALATSATTGFLYLPTTAGAPTGTPGSQAGAAPVVVDTTDNRFYFYSAGSWQQAGSGLSVPSSSLIGGNGTSLTSVTVGSGLTFSGSTLSVTNPLVPSAVALTGGTIDGTVIGGSTPAAATCTTLTATGNVVFSSGSALATSATTGFVYLPTTAGVPTGTPGTQAGGAPVVVDTTDNGLYFYSGGGWHPASPTVPTANLLGGSSGAFTSVTVSTGLTLSSGNLTVTNPYTAANVLQVTNNLSDVNSRGLARMNIDQGTVALTSGTTVATNCALGNVFTLTLATNATLSNPTNLVAGAHYMWKITQDATGSRTLAYGTVFKWVGGVVPTLSTGANQVDLISAISDGTNVYGVLTNNFA